MNREKIEKLIKVLEKSETYNQATYVNECGTPACIAGHAVMMEEDDPNDFIGGFFLAAQQILGLSLTDASLMFHETIVYDYELRKYADITKEMAIDMLKRFLETGQVEWRLV
jgi:hypothetical protein